MAHGGRPARPPADAHAFLTFPGPQSAVKSAWMRKGALLSLFLLLVPGIAAARQPVVVELYTAQGCGSCAEANEFLGKLAERPGVLALIFPVDYWDYLGWPDTFAKPEFAARQRAYVTKLALREPYTPQVVVDGRKEAAGLKPDQVERLVREATVAPHNPPDIRFVHSRRVDVGSGRPPPGGGEVWLVRYDPRAQEVAVKSGENRGQNIVQKNVVREIVRLGPWRGKPAAYRFTPATEEGLKTVVIVQAAKGGRVLGVGQPRS